MQASLFFLAEQLVFCSLIFWGMSFILQTKLWIKLVKLIYSQNEQTFKLVCLVSGFIYLPLGLFLVLTHNDWELSPSVIVTLLGWLIVIKCLVLLLYPQIALKCRAIYVKSDSFLTWYLRICGALYILLGALVLTHFWIF